MDFDNRKVYGDTSITDGLVFFIIKLTQGRGNLEKVFNMILNDEAALKNVMYDNQLSK